eukprot:CAMPEP_0204537822 /NCGR_PEP_ID=MMETSP0661-20131031/15532_1 /ASSEMBLY_ACC=CAM_ASM_000606 /TAXON_ID=109239 /ORGANISM="Alexandrium margalefi, Strain AMGDE01CS-322" /LENGTH=64 /DNA_ID=CAMNT_0051544393 /DNA_START=262 /DNA_END=456 /DNA_ORIENTATION=-
MSLQISHRRGVSVFNTPQVLHWKVAYGSKPGLQLRAVAAPQTCWISAHAAWKLQQLPRGTLKFH